MSKLTFQEYISSQTPDGPVKIQIGISKRWAERVEQPGLQGTAGALAYLERYGRNIAAKKVIQLALKATLEGDLEMAQGFWAKAYFLTFDEQPELNGAVAHTNTVLQAAAPSSGVNPCPHGDFGNMQPGNLATMQAVDAKNGRRYYVNNDIYVGQVKHNGHRAVLFVDTDGGVQMQMRSLNMRPVPAKLQEALLDTQIEHLRPFILDGELLYLDANGQEDQTAAAAAEIGGVATLQYMVFQCLMQSGQDQRTFPIGVRAGRGLHFAHITDEAVQPTIPFIGKEQKGILVTLTEEKNLEGEVWTIDADNYIGGKNGEVCVRTKHLFEGTFEIVEFTPTTAADREFGAIEIQDSNGIAVGRVGTGFTRDDQRELMQAGVGTKIKVRYQAVTNAGKLVHARYLGMFYAP